MRKLGFIGLGTLGKPMAEHLLAAGFALTAYNRTRARAEELARLGAAVADTPGQAARSAEAVVTCLPDDTVVEEVVLGKNGVIHGAEEGSVLIEMSTISPLAVRKIARELAARGVQMLDAPVTRGSRGAREGALAIMVGGERAIFERCRPVFEAVGKDVFYMGGIGMGAVAKAVNNLLAFVNTAVIMEAFALGVKAGADPAALYRVISAGSGNSYQVQQRVPNVLRRDFDPVFFSMDGAFKDLDIATSLAKELKVPMLFAPVAQQLYQIGRAAGLGDRDAGAVVLLYERLMGIQVGSVDQLVG